MAEKKCEDCIYQPQCDGGHADEFKEQCLADNRKWFINGRGVYRFDMKVYKDGTEKK